MICKYYGAFLDWSRSAFASYHFSLLQNVAKIVIFDLHGERVFISCGERLIFNAQFKNIADAFHLKNELFKILSICDAYLKNTNLNFLSNCINRFRYHLYRRRIFSYLLSRLMVKPRFENFFQLWLRDNLFRLIMFQAVRYKTNDIFVQCMRFFIVPGGIVNHNRNMFFLHHLRVEKYLAHVTSRRRCPDTVLVGINLRWPERVEANPIRVQLGN